MKVGQTLRVWYTYADPENDAQSGTTFQWYTYTNVLGAGKTPIAGATSSTYKLTAAEQGLQIGVEVTPKNAVDGFGAVVEFKAFEVGNSNPVYPDAISCFKPGGSAVPTPGNQILNPSSSLCSPRSLTWQVQYTGVNWRNNTTGNQTPKIIIIWGDGITETLDPGLQNPFTSTFDTGLYNQMLTRTDTLNLTNILNQNWRVEQAHTFDYTIAGRNYSTTANEKCTYTMTTTWGVGAFGCLGNGSQTQKFAVWDKETNTNLGTLDMGHVAGTGGFENPVGANITSICPFDRTAIRISDQSDFDCTPGGIVESTNPNDQARWVQFVYGTTNTMTFGSGAGQKITIGGVDYDASQLPIYGPVLYVPAAPTGTPMTPSAVTMDIQVPTTATATQKFTITMRTWNICHPFDNNTLDGDGLNADQSTTTFNIYGPPGTAVSALGAAPYYANGTPALTTYDIQITNAPPPPTVTYTQNHCDTDADVSFLFTTSHSQANSTLRWYSDAAMTDLEKSSTSSNTFNPISEGTAPLMDKSATSQDKVINYYVTEQWPGATGCLSQPSTLTFHITDTNNGGVIDHPNEIGTTMVVAICNGDNPPAFTNATSATGGNGTYNYQWQSSATTGGPYTDIAGATAATYDPPAISTTTFYVRKVSSGFCNPALSNEFKIRVDNPVLPGSISGDQTVCETADPAIITSSSPATQGDGSTYAYQWESSTTSSAGPFNTVAGATSATYDPPVTTQTTYFRRRVTSGSCTADGPDADTNPDNIAYAGIVTITVHQVNDPGAIGNPQTICSGGDPTALTNVTPASGGDGVNYSYQWQSAPAAAGPWTDIAGATATTFDPSALTSTTFYRRRVRSPGPVTTTCAETFTNVIQITVNPLPAGDVTGGGSICSPPPSPAPDMIFTFSAGTGPWDLVYSINAVNQPTVVGTSSPYTISSPGVGVYRIVSIKDANGCIVTAPHANITTSGPASVIIGGAPPAFDTAPALAAAAVCSAGGSTTDPSLSFDLNAASTVTGSNYTLSYKVDGGSTLTKTFQVDASGLINQVNGSAATSMTFNQSAFNNVGSHTLRVVSILSPTGCQTVLNLDLSFTVNPLPSGVNKTITAACSPNTINVDIFNTSVATAAGGNNVTSTYTWTAVFNGLTGMAASGSGNFIAGTLTNPTNTSKNAVFTITPTSTATPACAGSTFTITVPVSPLPTIFDRTAEICSGQSFSITPADGIPATTIVPVGTTYTWTIPTPNANITGTSNQATPQSSIGQTLTNITNVVQTVRYVVTPKAGSCTGATFNIDVTVDPKPVIFNYIAAICSGGTFSITPLNGSPGATTIVPAGTTYSWPAPTVTGGVTGGSAASNQSAISQSLSNSSTSPQTATYTVTATSGAQGSCVATSTFQVVVTVNPIPKLAPQAVPDICSGTFTYNPSSLTSGATFAWSRAAVAGINESASSGTGNISETLTNPTTSAVNVTYVIVTSANSCSNAPGENVVVKVNPTPIANPVLGPANVCVGTTPFFYSVTQHAGATYSWDIPATFSVEAAGGGAVAGGGPGAYTSDYFILLKFTTATPPAGLTVKVREKSADGCIGAPNNLTIVAANSPPTVPISGGTSFCKFQKGVVFSVPQNASSTFTWSVNSGATIVGPAAGTNLYQIIVDFNSSPSAQIDVTETNITGCPANYPSLIVSMLDAPVITPQSKTICSGDQPSSVVDLDAITSVPSTFAWFVKSITSNVTGAFVNDTGSGPLQHLPALKNVSGTNGTIVYTVTPTASSSPFCIGVPVDITVTVKPEPVVNAIADQSFCPLGFVNGAVSFPLSSNVAGAVINWTSSNPAIGLAAPSGTGNFSFTAADNQTGSDIVSTITVSATAAGCTSSGSNVKTFTITIKPRPVVAAITDIIVCPGDPVSIPTFSANTTGGETYAWSNDNTAIGLAGSGSGNIAGYFAPANNSGSNVVGNISVTATRNSCAGPATTFKITVKPQPVVATVVDKFFCPGDPINIPLTSNVSGATINWSNTNTATGLLASGSGDITGTAPTNNTGADIVGTFTVSAVANGCTSTGTNVKTFNITIKPTPIVTTVTDIVVCSGASVPATAFSSNIVSGGVIFNWSNSNTAINLTGSGSGGLPAFTAATNVTGAPMIGTINVTGTKNSCSGPVMSFTITVNPEPVVATVLSQEFCPGDPINIPLSSNVSGAGLNWTNSNPSIGIGFNGTGSIAYTAPANNTGADIIGTITVSATANGCTSTGTNQKTFTIKIKPTPIVNAISDINVCSGASISTIVFSANTGGGETFSWTNDNTSIGLVGSGTGNILGYTAPVNISGLPIVANIVVSATRNTCPGPTKAFQIIVNPEPVVAPVSNQAFCPGESINIPFSSNVASAAITWTNTNPAINLGVSGGGDIVYVAPINNSGSDIVGTIDVFATKNGCVSAGANKKTFTITIKPTPIVNSVTNITVCSGGTIPAIAFGSNITSGGVTFDWTNDNTAVGLLGSGTGNIASFTAGLNLTATPITATVSVTGTKNNCSGPTRTFTITVLPQPVGSPVPVSVCSDAAVAVNLNSMISGAAATYNIAITNTASLPASAGSPANANGVFATEIQDDRWTNLTGSDQPIVYHITPIGPGSPGCVGATFDLTVTIKAEPVVTAVTNKEFCPGEPVNIPLTSNVSGAAISWTNTNPLIGVGTTGSNDIVYTSPANNTGSDITGTVTVSASKNGCVSSGTNLKSFDIKIKPTPIINQQANIVVCSGATIPAINFTSNTGGGETYTWTNSNAAINLAASGGGNIPSYTAPVNLTGSPITGTITVNASKNSCGGPAMVFTITISPEPVVTAVPDKAFCAGEAVNIPLTSNVAGAGISWTNSNGGIGIGIGGTGDIVFTAPSNNTGADKVGTITVNASKDGCTSSGTNSKVFTITIRPTPIVNSISDITVCSGQTIVVPAFGSNVVSGGVTFDWTNDNPAINLLGNGTGNITSFTAATNISGSPMTANISVTGTKNNCSGPAVSFRITINPEPVVTAVTDKEFCPGQSVNIPLTSNVSGAGISWSNSNTSIGILGSGTGDIVYTAPPNNTGADFVGTITVTASKNLCTSTGANSKTFQITIKATPVVATIPNINVCSGDNIPAIAFTSNADPGVTFNWFNDNTSINLGPNGTNTIPAFTAAMNTGSVPMIANIRVNGTKNGCTGADQTFKITIFPEPVLGVSPPAPVCSETKIGVLLGTNGSSVSAQSYRIDNIEYSSNGGPFSTAIPTAFTVPATNTDITNSGLADLIKNDEFTNLSPFTVTVRYTIVPISSSNAASATGCEGDPATVSIGILPEPDLDNTLSPAAICSGETVLSGNPGFSLRSDPSAVGATSFIIRSISAPGLIAGSSNTGTGINKTATAINNDSWTNTSSAPVDVTYVIAPVTSACIGKDENLVVRVNPSPAVKDGLDRIVCNDTGSGIVLQDNSPTSVAADRYDIISVKVGGSPITPGGPAVGGLTANATNAPLGVTMDINAIRSDRYVNSTNDRVVVSYTIVPISAPALNSCRGPAKVITLTVEPQIISASITTTPVICSGAPINIKFASPTYSGAPTDPSVTFSYATLASSISGATVGNSLAEGATITDVLVNSTNTPIVVTYRITPRASGASNGVGCTGNFQDIAIRVEPKPIILPLANKTVCENTAVGILLKSNTVPTTGSIKIFVTSTPDPAISGASNNTLVANNTTLGDLLQNSSSVTKFVTYHLEARNVDATNATICTSGAPIDVVVGVSPTPVFTPIPNFAICSGESFAPIVINTDTETATPGSTIVTWTATPSGDVSGESNGAGNSFSQVLSNPTSNKQTVAYTLNATNISNSPSCPAAPIPLTVTVYPNPKVVGLPTSVNVCNNGTLSPNPYTIQASTAPALGATFDWIVDNGGNNDLPVISNRVNQTQISQTFVNNGSFLGTQQYSITAHLTIPAADNPIIDATLGIDNVCTAQTDAVMVVNVAPQVGGDIYGFDIDGNTATNLYLCKGSKQFVYMDPVGLPLMTIDYEENGVAKQLTKLGGLSVLQVSPSATSTYKLTKITDKFGCSISPNKTVTVNVGEVDNNFSIVGPDINCSPFPVTFTHNQVAGTSYTWKWLDGPDSTTYLAASTVAGKLIKHTYLNPSPGSTMKFRASLDAFLDTTKYLAGCRKKPVVVEVKVYPTVAPAVFADRDVICSSDPVSFTNSTQGATSHRWFYRVAGSATELEVKTTSIVTFKIANTTTSNPLQFEVVYQSTNGHCPAPDVVTPITVYRGVDAHFSHTTPTLFTGGHSTVTITNDSSPVDPTAFRYDWAFGLNATPETASSAGPTFNLDYTTPGPKELSVTATNTAAEAAGLSCFDEYKETINIAVPPLIADFIVVPLQACFPTDIKVTENRATGDKFNWRVLDAAGTAAQSNADLPVFKIPAPGKYTVELTTINSFTGDQKTATKDVIVYDLPMASFDFRPGVVYVPDTEMLTYNFSDGATGYLWDFGDGSTSDEKEPTHTYKVEGVYDILLIAQNDHGNGIVCVDTLSRKITAKQGGVTRIPNAFTPNPNHPSTSTGGNPEANSFNDVFLPQVKGADEFNMQIFDRWGNLIFESKNSNMGWDGYDKAGKLLPAGVYVYKLTLRLSDGQRTTQVGDITMIR